MATEVPRELVQFILLGPEDDRRQLQDSPVLGDVWIAYAKEPDKPQELLITPFREHAAGKVATTLAKRLKGANIAYLQGIIAARLTLRQLVQSVIPMTSWRGEKRIVGAIDKYASSEKSMQDDIEEILFADRKWMKGDAAKGLDARQDSMRDMEPHTRYLALAGLLLWAQDQQPISGDQILDRDTPGQIVKLLRRLTDEQPKLKDSEKSLVWHVSLNRTANAALTRSVPAVKADAARTLFTVDCHEIVWAVIDSGIDGSHDAFKDKRGGKRILKSFDFTRIREIVSLDNVEIDLTSKEVKKDIKKLLRPELRHPLDLKKAAEYLEELAAGASKGRSIDWELVEPFVEIEPETRPPSSHGTHVAGILGARRQDAKAPVVSQEKKKAEPGIEDDDDNPETADSADGMCPDIKIYDFRVLAPTLKETEFAIIAALQYIRYINERNSFVTIHGANLSLSIRHDVRNYACGRTPICNECERLINSGVVVVAAAGNRGFQNFETKEGLYEGYAAFSVTDPGNADGVITVGATHRYWPHTYGVSFFSSRGPTGDGRMKPDLVAPGERIRAPLPDNMWGDLDGTSMAAPHVSGAAAMLMGRYSELIGQPRRIKKILCDSATDLGRERSFQGHGMLDVLRALQSI